MPWTPPQRIQARRGGPNANSVRPAAGADMAAVIGSAVVIGSGAEAEAIAAAVIARGAQRWRAAEGFAFSDGPGQQASLQGTEMWLSVMYLAADLLGLSDEFAFVPKGVHPTRAAGLGL